MKYLKYLLYLIISYDSEIMVNKSAAEAWAVMSDEANLPKWISGFKKSELISGTANTAGAVSKVYVEEQGHETVMQETIKEAILNEKMAMEFTMDFMNMDYEMNFDEKDGKTTIRSSSKTTGNGIFAKSM